MNIAVDMVALDKDGRAGGVTWLTLELVKGFSAIGDTRVIGLCTDDNREFLSRYLGDKVILVPLADRRQQKTLTRRVCGKIKDTQYVNSILEKYGADIFFCPFGIVNYRVKKAATVSVILDVQHEFFSEFFDKKELLVRRLIYRYIAHSARRVICISEYTRDTFCDKYKYDKNSADVVYIAIQDRFDGQDDTILRRLGLENDGYILYPANCWKHKNHERLIMSFNEFAQKNKNIKLVLTGNMFSQEERLKSIADSESVRQRIIIAGYVDDNEMNTLLEHCKGLIFPSLFEGFGIPVVEAMSQHKLIACSNTTSLPEIGCDSVYYFNPTKVDEIADGLRYISETEVTDKIIKDYDDNLKKFDKDKMINEYMKIFSDVLRRN